MQLTTDLGLSSRPHRPRNALPPTTLHLDFVADVYHPASFSTLVTFARAGSASRINPAGTREFVAADIARFEHEPTDGQRRGLLIEESRTNLVTGSTAPVSQAVNVSLGWYALSFEGTGSITLSGAHTATVTGSAGRSQLLFQPAAGALTLTISGAVSNAQLEAGNCVTSYITTTVSPVTRAADTAALALGSWWNASEGSVMVEWLDIHQQAANSRILAMNGAQSLINLANSSGTNNAFVLQNWNGTSALSVNRSADITKGIRRAAIAWSAGGRSLAVAGILTSDSNPVFTGPQPTHYWLGSQSGGLLGINGCLRRLRFWPQRLSDSSLTELTL